MAVTSDKLALEYYFHMNLWQVWFIWNSKGEIELAWRAAELPCHPYENTILPCQSDRLFMTCPKSTIWGGQESWNVPKDKVLSQVYDTVIT